MLTLTMSLEVFKDINVVKVVKREIKKGVFILTHAVQTQRFVLLIAKWKVIKR